jgi:SAM-dependent methyltransferase
MRIPAGATILDAGAGSAPYYELFQHTQYESADFQKVSKPYGDTTYVCDLRQIPVESARFDFVVFNQTMEHIPEPKLVLGELHRVMKPGATMIYTGPLFYEEHEQPYDFYRYTQFGLRYLFESVGFHIERLDWLEGYFGTVAYQLNCAGRYLPISPRDLSEGIIGYVLVPVLLGLRFLFLASSLLFHKMETMKKFTGSGYPKNYVAIVTRPIK